MQIRFQVPADPRYPGQVAAALGRARLRRYTYIGVALAVVGALGLLAAHTVAWGDRVSPLGTAMVIGGLLSALYPSWVRWRAQRRSSGYAVEGDYDIDDVNIMMRSGTESSGIAWDGVTLVEEAPAFWIVYVGRMPATVIPRRLMSAADDQTLRAFMAQRGLLTPPPGQ